MPTFEELLTFAAPASMKALQEYRDTRLQEQAFPLLGKFAVDYENLAGPDKRFFADPESRAVLQESGLQIPSGATNPHVRKGLQDFAEKGQLENDFADIIGGNATPGTYGRLAVNPTAQAQHNLLSTLLTGQNHAAVQAAAESKAAEEAAGKANIAQFQKATAGLTGPAQSPTGIARFAKTGGYDPDGESDILQAAAAYGVPSEVANKEVDNYRQKMEKTPIGDPAPYSIGTGRSTEAGLLQKFVLGAPKNIANTTSTAPVTNVTIKGGVAQSSFVDPSTGKPLVFDKATGSYRVANVEGAVVPKPAAFTPESAAKAQMVEQALTYIPLIRAGLILPNGNVDRENVANMNIRTPFTEGRKLSTYVMDAVEAKLRAESGAAVPEPEVARAAKRFIPAIGDNDAQVKIKLNNLETYLKGTSEKINQGRPKTAQTSGSLRDAAAAELTRRKRLNSSK